MLPPALPENEAVRLQALRDCCILDSAPEERYDRLTRLCRKMFGTQMALISLVDSDRQWFKSRQGLDACETPRDISFCGHAILTPDILHVSDASLDPRFADNPLVSGSPNIRFYAGAPLTLREGIRIGTLCIIDDQPRTLSANELQALRDLADCVEDEIRNIALRQHERELRRTTLLTASISRAQSLFIQDADRNQAFDGLLSDLLALTESEYGFIGEVLFTAEGSPYLKTYAITNIAWNEATREFYQQNAPKGMEFFNLNTLFGVALTSEQPVIANSPANDPRRGGLPDGHPALNAFLGIPIHHRGKLLAMIGIANRPGGYDQALIDFLKPLLATIGQLIEAVRNQAENRKNQIELARLSRVASETTNGVVITDAAGRVEWINEGFTRLTGYRLDEMCGRRPGELLHGPDTDPQTVANMVCMLERGEPFEAELINYSKSGRPYWVHISCDPLRDADGALQGFMSIESDISERKAAAEQLRATTQLLDSIVDNVPNIIFLKRASDLRFEFLNRAGERLLGLSRDQFLGRNDYDFFPTAQADFFTSKDRAVLAQGGILDIPEESVETPTGTRLLHTQKLVLKNEHGEAQYLLGISEDITERKRVDRMKNEFVSIVSHELRTPLTAISGSLGLMAGGAAGELPERARDLVQVAHRNSERLAGLINDLLDMEKLVAGKMQFRIEPHALWPQLQQALQNHRSYADQFKVQLALDGDDDSLCVAIDCERLQQTLANLLSNASKFSPAGGRVMVRLLRRDGRARVEVQDHGPGIPLEFRDRIFQKFAQADASDRRIKGGTGLGLAITRELVERMGGTIGFSSEIGNGTTFYFELPLCDGESAEG